MASSSSRYEVEVTVSSARDLKNVNWRYGDLKPYAVLWVDPATKCSARVDAEGDVNPVWDETLRIPLPYDRPIHDSALSIDVVHAGSDDTKPLVGSARLPLREVVDEAGIGGGKVTRNLELKRPSGRPHGKIEVRVAVEEPSRYNYYEPYAAPYGQFPGGTGSSSRDYPAPPPPYGGQPPCRQPQYGGAGYARPYSAAPGAGYPYSAPPPPGYYRAPPPVYGQGCGQPAASYGWADDLEYGGPAAEAVQQQQGQKKKSSKFGMGTGLAVGAVAGVLGGLALAEGVDYVEDKMEDDAAERVDDDLAYEDGGYEDF